MVNRRQMALFFTRFLELAPVGEGGVDINTVAPDDRVFTDIDRLTDELYNAIRLIYELGVSKGTTATTYGPEQPVTRAQMALFVSRMLGHTNARPAGITMQVEDASVTAGDTVDLVVSLRDKNHAPLADVSVDLFYVADGDDGFLSSGRCSSKAILEAGSSRCAIDLGDETTDGDGNLFYTMEVPESLAVYAWTGDRNDRFDVDETAHASLEIGASKKATGFLLTDDMPEGARHLPFGTTVTFTFQVVDEDARPLALEDAEIRIETRQVNDSRPRVRTKTYSTDRSGRVELSFRLNDPDSNRSNPKGELYIVVLGHDYKTNTNGGITDESTVKVLTSRLLWSDEDAEPWTLLLEQSSVYSTATDSGDGGHNRVIATLLDQYGAPVRGKRIHFTSTDRDGLWQKDNGDAQNAFRKTTNRRGEATVNYTRDSDTSTTEPIHAIAEGCSTCTETVKHYWVDDDFTLTQTDVDVLYYDADAETFVLKDPNADPVYAIAFDSQDQFYIWETINNVLVDTPVRYQAFKEALAEVDAKGSPYDVDVVITGTGRDDVNRFTL